MDPCEHGEHPLACIDCLNEGKVILCRREPTPKRVHHPWPDADIETDGDVEPVGDSFIARYVGHCDRCTDDIESGEPIVRMSNGRYYHADCADTSNYSPWSTRS